jgi:hypothetical protein
MLNTTTAASTWFNCNAFRFIVVSRRSAFELYVDGNAREEIPSVIEPVQPSNDESGGSPDECEKSRMNATRSDSVSPASERRLTHRARARRNNLPPVAFVLRLTGTVAFRLTPTFEIFNVHARGSRPVSRNRVASPNAAFLFLK